MDLVGHLIYLLIGREVCRRSTTWKVLTFHMLMTNLVMAVIICLILMFQGYLPLNPLGFPGMIPLLASNTTVSFITNTDGQAYSGETTLSNLSQMGAIIVHVRSQWVCCRDGLDAPLTTASDAGAGLCASYFQLGHRPRFPAGLRGTLDDKSTENFSTTGVLFLCYFVNCGN